MNTSSDLTTVIFIVLGLGLLWAVISLPGQGMVAVGALMIMGGGFGLVTAKSGTHEISSMILFVGGGLTVGVGLTVIQLQEIRTLLKPSTPSDATKPQGSGQPDGDTPKPSRAR